MLPSKNFPVTNQLDGDFCTEFLHVLCWQNVTQLPDFSSFC
jgi:hypothetical protein